MVPPTGRLGPQGRRSAWEKVVPLLPHVHTQGPGPVYLSAFIAKGRVAQVCQC